MIVIGESSVTKARRAGMRLTMRQLLIGMATEGIISSDEAVQAALGVMPAAFADDDVAARITWARMTEISRTDPIVARVWPDPAMADGFFETYSTI